MFLFVLHAHVKQTTMENQKTSFISFNLFGSIGITNTFFSVLLFLLVVFLFFWRGGGVVVHFH